MDFLTTLRTQLIPQAATWLTPLSSPGSSRISLPFSPEACVLLGAICLQESGGKNVAQLGGGPASGYPQMEPGGIRAVLANAQSASLARIAVERSGILEAARKISDPPVPENFAVGEAGGYPSIALGGLVTVLHANFLNFPALQIALARLMLWDNPKSLPALTDPQQSWLYYLETWRPGKPRPNDWLSNYAAALAEFSPPAV